MGKFDGILICSDWDGTLFCNNTVPVRTQEALKYFMSEGGHFSITSGRPPEFLDEYKHLIKPNTYCICYGGSLVCDIESGEVLLRGSLGADAFEVIDGILASGVDIVRINAHTDKGIIHYTPKEYCEFGKLEAMAAYNYKLTFNCSSSEEGDRLKAWCDTFDSGNYTLARSFASYLEIMKTEYTKGAAARLLKEKLGAKVLIGMGDYENDIPLFTKCDLSFAVANAEDSLKQLATHVTRATVEDSAAEEVIRTLEKMLLRGEL